MPPVKSRRDQYSEATRAALLDAATALFFERSFAGAALEDVAAAAQVTRGAVYHHFTNKRDLFEAVLDALEAQAKQRVTAATQGVHDPWDAAMTGLDAFLEQCCDPVYGRLVWQEGPVALGWARWKECEEQHAYGLIEGFVRALIDAGRIAGPLDLTTRFCFHLLGAAGQALADADERDKPQTKEQCAALIRDMFAGLASG
ncbi:MAG TPA: TetR/AcrR family transcriptional regulator [Nocardioidaceae bacterium]|nr:TetR/AcrR family transcriptional regulator [Nocardioidaceae bacterium]